MARRVAVICALTLAVAASARAQNGSSGTSTGQSSTGSQTSSSSMATAEETRPATTTFNGDTGLWYVPTAEVLGKGQWSASVYRRGTNWVQGYTNVADFAGTFAYGVGGRAEVFGSFLVDTRIDRDSRPIFGTDPAFGSFIDRYPKVNQYWTGDNVGDFYVGAKYNIWSEVPSEPRGDRAARHDQAPDRQSRRRRQHRQGGLLDRRRRQQGSVEARGSVGVRRLRMARQPGRLRHPWRRVPLGHRPDVPVAQLPAGRRRVERFRAVQATWRPPARR